MYYICNGLDRQANVEIQSKKSKSHMSFKSSVVQSIFTVTMVDHCCWTWSQSCIILFTASHSQSVWLSLQQICQLSI